MVMRLLATPPATITRPPAIERSIATPPAQQHGERWWRAHNNTTGINNTANGVDTLQSNTDGSHNTATGYQALFGNTVGGQNTANGVNALQSNTDGAGNTAIGFQCARNNPTGNLNIALGFNAGSNLTSGDNNIYIGSLGVATESDTIRIGTSGVQTSAFIRGIRGVTTGNSDAVPVLIDSAGQLGTTSSSRRFKKEIKADGRGQRSDPVAQAGDVSLQERQHRHSAIWFDRRGSSEGESRTWWCATRTARSTPCATTR